MRDYLPGEEPFEALPAYDERYKYPWVGRVLRYDQDNDTCDVEWLNYSGGRPAVNVGVGMGGPRAFLGGPPEEGSLVSCEWIPQLPTGNYRPIIVSFFSTGFRNGRRFALVRSARDQAVGLRGTRFKAPKLYAGDLAMVSSSGSQVLVDENLLLTSAGMTETFHRSSDQAIITNALQHYMEGADSRLRWGMVERDPNYILGASPDTDPVGEDGRVLHYVTSGKDSSRLEDGGAAWVEHRIELSETSTGSLSIPETLHGKRPEPGVGNLRFVLGTLVGNDRSKSILYGKPLVREVLSGGSISRSYNAASDSTEEANDTSAFHLSVGSSESSPVGSVDLDKSGRLALSLGASSSGKSLQVAADGNLEVYFQSSGGYALDLQGDGDGRLSVSGNLEVSATSGNLEVSATGTTTVNGSAVYLGGASSSGSGRPL